MSEPMCLNTYQGCDFSIFAVNLLAGGDEQRFFLSLSFALAFARIGIPMSISYSFSKSHFQIKLLISFRSFSAHRTLETKMSTTF